MRNDHAGVRLIAATEDSGDGPIVRAGLQFQLRPGWKTYWRNPGDAGFATRVDWTASSNVADVTMRWPAPERFELFGLETFGYADEVVLPLDVRVAQRGAPIAMRGTVEYLVCERVCIPYTAELRLDLPAGPGRPSGEAHLINRYADRVPGSGGGLAVAGAALQADPAGLVVRVASTLPLDRPDAIIEGPEGWSFTRPSVTLSADRLAATLVLPVRGDGQPARALVGQSVAITLTDGARAGEGRAVILAAETDGAATTIVGIVALALLGGLILNVMPCVLPVLSLKLLGVVGQAGAARRHVRLSFIASAAGVLAAFLALAASLVALRAAGVRIGWGIQFQQPLFLTAMAVLVTLFAANLWGWLSLGLPGRLADSAVGGIEAADRHGSLAGSFVGGAFATLLATPCSAPFLGTAVGFALARGPLEIVLIFAALGLGLALPYLLLAAVPGLVRLLPRPGPWMGWLRRLLGIALIATALWLLSVLRAQLADSVVIAIGCVLLLLLLALRGLPMAARPLRAMACAGAAAAALALPLWSGGAANRPGVEVAGTWRSFDRERIGALVREGKVVFVDVTAAWCVTCQVNKAAVLARGPVAERLTRPDLVAMRADWTRPDPLIADYLASFGRYGIPFNAVYGPGAPEGVALPEILSDDAVLGAIERARGQPAAAVR